MLNTESFEYSWTMLNAAQARYGDYLRAKYEITFARTQALRDAIQRKCLVLGTHEGALTWVGKRYGDKEMGQ
ncbi:MAG: hypothetical protein L0H73_10400 [Nitrococcus sp.]|nr:hypothetical protein [Nitrococcus sp.]